MKRICLLLAVSLSIVACKKEKKVSDSELANQTAVDSISEPTQAVASIKEVTPEAFSETLKLSNDTLYVTNFFATWCGPCVREMPHFQDKIKELEGKKVKFTFVSLDEKSDWNTKVPEFGDKYRILDKVVLLDGEALGDDFFTSNFDSWEGASIPFTQFRQGTNKKEIVGMMTKETMEEQFAAFTIQ